MKKEEQVQQSYIGIDVSKLTLDVSIITLEGFHAYFQFSNTVQGFQALDTWLHAQNCFSYSNALFCMEHTGLYTRELVSFLLQYESKVWVESALHLKRSMGLTRGKNDRVDSYRIARYAMTNSDKVKLFKLSSSTLQRVKDLMSNRDRLNKSYQSLKVSMQEMERIDKQMGKELKKLNARALNGISASKLKIEKRIFELINEDSELKTLYTLVRSVKGVGNVLATELLIYTKGFTSLSNSRQLACYCGVAPFSHSSGTSVKGRTGTSNFANMNLKSTLHMAAISSIRYVPELKKYYERKVSEGKHKMSAINAVRNKLIQRILAVVKRGTPYEENYVRFNLENS